MEGIYCNVFDVCTVSGRSANDSGQTGMGIGPGLNYGCATDSRRIDALNVSRNLSCNSMIMKSKLHLGGRT